MVFPVRDVSDWTVVSQDARGLDPKDWVVEPQRVTEESQEHWWLFKPVKTASYRRHDDVSEKIAAELAKLMRLPAATVDLARRGTEEGVISRNVTPDGWSLQSGDTLLSEIDGYVSIATDKRPKNRVGHTWENISQILANSSGPPLTDYEAWPAIHVFVGYLVLDAWIANTDRHAENWAVLLRQAPNAAALAPSFDHGSALGSGIRETDLPCDVEKWVMGGSAGRFEAADRVSLVDFACAAARLHPRAERHWRGALRGVSPRQWQSITAAIPSLSDPRRTFINQVLDVNRRRLLT